MTTRYAPRNLQGLPTLTEVIDLPVLETAVVASPAPEGAVEPVPAQASTSPSDAVGSATAAPPALDESGLVALVLESLQRDAEPILETRLLAAIEPALARAAQGLVGELRAELAATLRSVVETAVGEELARRRGESG